MRRRRPCGAALDPSRSGYTVRGMGGGLTGKVAMAALFVAAAAYGQGAEPPALSPLYEIRYERWSEIDEKEYGRFIAELGDSGCATVDTCLHAVEDSSWYHSARNCWGCLR